MKVLFWVSVLLVGYAYVGYALVLWVVAKMRPRAVAKGVYEPTVTVVMAVKNEAANLAAKMENLRALDYPAEKMQIVVASDGSTDGTVELLRQNGVTVVELERSGGKAVALNAAVAQATGEVLLMLDARQMVDRGAVRALMANFVDAEVGAVSGELVLETPDGAPAEEGLGIYWTIEKMVRRLESATGSVVGVTGAIYAVRRELYREIPPGTILDDVYVPMQVARVGRRVLFEPEAIARDRIFAKKGKEFGRKVRTLTGNYQLVQMSPWMLTGKDPLLFRLVSHKLMRLAVPGLLVVMLVSSGLAGGGFYRAMFWLQVVFYAMAVVGEMWPRMARVKSVGIASTFVMLNAAAAVAFYNFVRGRSEVWG